MSRRRRSGVLGAAVFAMLFASAVPGAASAGEPYRCEPVIRIEPDAQGRVVFYPSARCTGRDVFKTIQIGSNFKVDDKLIDLAKSKSYSDKRAGVYIGHTSSAPNPPGNNLFCGDVIVWYQHALDTVGRQNAGGSCVKY